MALVIGPAAAGTLITLFDGSTVLFVAAATSAIAALITTATPYRLGIVESAAKQRNSLAAQLVTGVSALRSSRFLAGTVTLTVGLALALGGMQGLVLPLYYNVVSRPDLLGFVLTALAVVMLAGTTVFSAVGTRISRRCWMATGLVGTTAGFALMATLAGPAWVFAGAAVLGVANSILGAVLGVLQAERIPHEIRGRVLSVQNACLQVAGPAGIGLAATVAEVGSPTAAGLTVFVVWLGIAAALTASRALTDLDPVPADPEQLDSKGRPRAATVAGDGEDLRG